MTQKRNKLQTHQSSREFTYSSITKPGYPLLWTSFVLIIKIDESLNNEHLQNNCSVLNMWLGSSQNLGLQINNYGIKSSYSPNPLQVCGRINGHEISWTPITKKCNNTLGVSIFCIVITRKQELSTTIVTKKKKVGFLKGLMPTNVGFLGHLSPRR
jgi:hypothetical protein